MKKLGLAACAGLLIAFPAAARAQSDNPHSPAADQSQHDNSAPPADDTVEEPAAMRQRQMEMSKHMEDCRCPCCEMMEQHGGGMDKPGEDEAVEASPEPPEAHQH